MTRFTIRTATAQDEAAVTALLQACYPVLMAPDYDPNILEPALVFMCKANPDLLSSGTYYLAVGQNGEVIGCGGWTKARPATGETQTGLAHIRHFATHPDHIRIGVAAAIMQACFDAARANGAQTFECYSSLSAVPFYESQGFRKLKDIDIDFTPDLHFPSVHMACDLPE